MPPVTCATLDTYPCMPDILVNSFYDPETHEGAAYEELVGFHGGLGGNQNHPFLMYPAHLQQGDLPPIIGAPEVYQVIRAWKQQLHGKEGARKRPRPHRTSRRSRHVGAESIP